MAQMSEEISKLQEQVREVERSSDSAEKKLKAEVQEKVSCGYLCLRKTSKKICSKAEIYFFKIQMNIMHFQRTGVPKYWKTGIFFAIYV